MVISRPTHDISIRTDETHLLDTTTENARRMIQIGQMAGTIQAIYGAKSVLAPSPGANGVTTGPMVIPFVVIGGAILKIAPQTAPIGVTMRAKGVTPKAIGGAKSKIAPQIRAIAVTIVQMVVRIGAMEVTPELKGVATNRR